MSSEFKWDVELIGSFLEAKFPLKVSSFKEAHTPQADSRDEKDWEILTCYDENPHIIHNYISNNSDGESCDSMGCKIHSVKRLTDNEVLTIDDTTDVGVVHSFYVEDGGMFVKCKRFETLYEFALSGVNKSAIQKEGTKPLSERVEVKGFSLAASVPILAEWANRLSWYQFGTTQSIPYTKQLQISQAIEAVLNDEPIWYKEDFAFVKTKGIQDEYNGSKFYTQKEVDEMCERVALAFIHHTEFKMENKDWLDNNGELRRMEDVYDEFISKYKNQQS